MLLKEERIRIARERTEKEARKGYNIRINNIENQQNNLKDRIDFLETGIHSLKSVVDELNNNR